MHHVATVAALNIVRCWRHHLRLVELIVLLPVTILLMTHNCRCFSVFESLAILIVRVLFPDSRRSALISLCRMEIV